MFCDVDDQGRIKNAGGAEFTGAELIQHCCDHDVKVLWCASGNPPEGYIKGFKARGKRLNVVMTVNRNGANFPTFLERLLSRMAYGESMAVAWSKLCPQIPGSTHTNAPDSIFFAGRGGVKLLAH